MKGKILAVVFLLLVLRMSVNAVSVDAQTCTYYVSSSTGSDNSDGLTESTAWKTITRINQHSLSPGDTVCFKRGDTWRFPADAYLTPKNGNPSGYIAYDAYGVGPKPLFFGSVEKNSPSDWTETSTPNIWTTAANVFPNNVGNLIFNNEQAIGDMVLVSERSQTDWPQCPVGYIQLGVQNGNTFCVGIDPSQPDTRNLNKQGDFLYDWFNKKLLLYSVGNPATYYSDIECALHRHLINVSGKSYVKVINLDLRYGGAHGIWANNSSYIRATDNDLSFIGGAIQSPTTPGWARTRFGNGIEFWASNNNMYVERNRISEVYEDALTIQGGGSSEQHYHYFRNNIIKNARFCFAFWNSYSGISNTSHVYFENNTCVDMGSGFGGQTYGPSGLGLKFEPRNMGNTSDYYVQNNIIYNTNAISLILADAPDDQFSSMGNLVMDYNAYYQLPGVTISYPPCLWCDPWGITCQDTWDTGHQDLTCTDYDFPSYLAVTTNDSHSIEADPLFIDYANNDFRPAAGSPVCTMSETGGYIGAVACIGSDTDSDNDGMTDGFEIVYGLNFNDPLDTDFDNDYDGLTNLEEFWAGTDPTNPDSDNDGIVDGADNCPNISPINIAGTSLYYASIQSTYDAAVNLDIILSQEEYLSGALNFNNDISLTMRGGFDCSYATNTGKTVIKGELKMSKGSIKIDSGSFKFE